MVLEDSEQTLSQVLVVLLTLTDITFCFQSKNITKAYKKIVTHYYTAPTLDLSTAVAQKIN